MVALGILLVGFTYVFLRYGRNYYTESIVYVAPAYSEGLPQQLAASRPDASYDPLVEHQVKTVTRHDILLKAVSQLPHSYFPRGAEQASANNLASNLQVERVPNTYQVRIGLRGDDPKRITDIVNGVTKAYLDVAQKEESFGRDQTAAALRSEHEQIEKDLAGRQQEQAELEHQLGVASYSPSATNPYNERIARLNSELVDARNRLHSAEAQIEAVHSGDEAGAVRSGAAENIASDTGLNSLQDQYRTNLRRARDYEASISHDLATAEASAAMAAPRFQKVQDLSNGIQHDEERAHAIEDRIVSLNLESSIPGSIHLFSSAQQPVQAETSKAFLFLLLLTPIALISAIVVAVLSDVTDKIVHSPNDVERTVGLPTVGVLFDRNEVSQDIENEYAFRLGATLDHARRTANVRTFAFTSVHAGEGTTTVVNLVAQEMAQLGNRVLVLDAADLREPVAFIPPEKDDPHAHTRARTVHSELGMAVNARGRNLPSIGTVTDAFRKAYGDFDVLLLDCAPLLISADTEYQVRQADATLLIAEAGATQKPDLLRSARLLERLRVPGLAIVLNRLHVERAGDDLREDIKAYEAYGRRLHSAQSPAISPFVDGTTFRTKEIQGHSQPESEAPVQRENPATFESNGFSKPAA